jgi:hypothetical protein
MSPAPSVERDPEDHCGPVTNGDANPNRPNGGPIPIGDRDHNPIRVPNNTRRDTIPNHANPIASRPSFRSG